MKQQLRQACYSQYQEHDESKLSQITKHVIHYQVKVNGNRELRRTTDILVSIREPVARFESWFRNQSPHNCNRQLANLKVMGAKGKCTTRRKAFKYPRSFQRRFWYDCFPHVNDMALALHPTHPSYGINATNITDCHDLVYNAFQELGMGAYGHLSAGYRWYSKQAKMKEHNKTIWAVRTENLWQDIKDIDRALGGSGEDFHHIEGIKESHGSELFKDQTGLDDSHRIYVCCQLRPDIEAYRVIVDRAANLNASEKLHTYQQTWQKCNVTSWGMLDSVCDSFYTQNS